MKSARGTAQSEKPIQVFVRVRPLNQSEKNSKSFSVVSVNNDREISVRERPTEKVQRNFCFDKTFGPDSKQVDVYKKVVYPLIEEVLAGYNCTVFAYGQTGTGKTFTMEGGKSLDKDLSWENDPLTGIIPRSLSHLFDELRISQLEHSVRVSFLELYNEELFDLLSPPDDANKLRLFEDSAKKGSVIIQNLEEVPVANKAELYKVMEKGSQKRQTAATLMNAHSSRSHTIFSITVHIKETSDKGEELFKIGKLNLVDLAGSENIGRSGAVDKRAREAGNINQSLLTLGRVITSLVEKAPHIPYRESKLTRLLQDSLGGRTKTSIIATISPALCNLEETMSTLEYAARAKNITNRPEVNQKLTKKAFLKEYEAEIDRLKRDLQASRDRNGVYVDSDNYTTMVLQLEEQQKEISENLSMIKALKGEMEKREEIYNELSTSFEKAKDEIEKRKEDCRKTRTGLKEVTIDRNVNKILKEKHMETEAKLRKEAEQILSVADVATSDTVKLHEKINRKGSVETNNVSACDQFCSSLKNFLAETEISEKNQKRSTEEFFNLLKNAFSNLSQTQSDCVNDIRTQLRYICQTLSERIENFTSVCQSLRNEKHETLSKSLNELKLKLDSNNDALDSSILKGIIPQLSEAFNQLNELDKFLIEFNQSGKKVNGNLCYLKEEINRLKTFTKERIEKHVATLSSIQIEENVFDKLETEFSDLMTSRVENRNKFFANLQQVISDFKETEERTDEQSRTVISSRIETVKNTRLLTEKLSASIKDDFRECEPKFSEVTALVNTVDDSLDSQQTALAGKLESWKNSQHSRLEVVKVNVEDLSSVSKESKKIFCDWSKDFSETLQKSDTKDTQAETEEQEALVSIISEQVTDSESTLDSCVSCHETAVTEIKNNVDDRLSNSGKVQDEIIKNLQMQNRLVDQFLQEDIKKDVPTGCTPQKRDFEYPRNLSATSPHETILARYREAIHKVVVPDLTFNDSLNESAVSIASEEISEEGAIKESSSCESLSMASSVTSLDSKENDTDSVSSLPVKKVPQSSVSKKRPLMATN